MSKNSHRKREQASKQNGTSRIAAMPSTPSGVVTLKDVVRQSGRCIFLVVRIRPNPPGGAMVRTIGSGFLAAPYRFITAAHVLDNTDPGADELAKHRDGDIYGFVSHDDNDRFHWHWDGRYKRDQDIFIYPDKDLGIVHLGNNFYGAGMEKACLTISETFSGIATPVGVLGYPITQLEFEGGDFNKPRLGNVLLRGDQGVINTRYTIPGDIKVFEFTMAFNNGNSGGPIIDLETGNVVSWVKGYRKIDVELKEKDIPNTFTPREYTQKTYIESIQATYSVGIATASVLKELREHDVILNDLSPVNSALV